MRLHRLLPTIWVVLPALLLALASSPASAQGKNYVAVGDSLAYGFMDLGLTPVGTDGFAGYAQPYAAFLGLPLINLGIVGETTTSLLHNGGENNDLNSHYTTLTSQSDLLPTYLSSDTRTVTIQVGANDLIALAATDAFQLAVATGNTDAQKALLGGTLATVATNYDTLLTQIDTLAPGANVQIIGYYSPYGGLAVTDPNSAYLHGISDTLALGLNGVLEGEAAKHGAQYVDIYGAFHGSEATLLLNGDLLDTPYGLLPNDHPTAAGYAVITQKLEAAAVPEASTPVSFGLLAAFGLGGMLAARRKKVRV